MGLSARGLCMRVPAAALLTKGMLPYNAASTHSAYQFSAAGVWQRPPHSRLPARPFSPLPNVNSW